MNHKSFIKITGYAKEEIIGMNPRIMKSEKHNEIFYQEMMQRLEKRGEWQGEIWNKRKNGESYPEFISISTVKDEKGKFLNYIAI